MLYVRLLYDSGAVDGTQPPERGWNPRATTERTLGYEPPHTFSINKRGSFVQSPRRGISSIIALRSFQRDMTVSPDAMFDVGPQQQRSGAIRLCEEVTHPQQPSIVVQAGPRRMIGNFGFSLHIRIWRHLAARIDGKRPLNRAIFSYST